MGHGHVIPNSDGSMARCGGVMLCDVCNAEFASLKNKMTLQKEFHELMIKTEKSLTLKELRE